MERLNGAIHGADITVITIYFLIVVVIGVYVSRQTQSGDDLFLAGRSLTWAAIGLSLFASNISTTTIIGLTGSAYADGISVSAYEWMAGVPLILLAFVFAPLYFKSRITTVPEYLEYRFDRRVRQYFSAMTILLTVIIDTAGGLYAGGVVMRTFFPQFDLWIWCAAIGLFAGLYTAAGGLRAVVYTDVLQAIVLIVGSSAITYVMFAGMDFSWEKVVAAAPVDHFSVVQPMHDPQLPWPGLFTGVVLLGFWYWVTNQYIVQRVLGAKNLQHAQWGAMLGGMLKFLPLFIMVLPGAMAISQFPNIPNKDMVFAVMATEALPIGLTGLVLAGLMAAIMSSVDSTLNSSSTLIVHDFVFKNGTKPDPYKSRRYGRVTTIVLMLIAILWAPQIKDFGGLWSYLQQAFSILVPPIAAIFLVGAFLGRGTASGALWALIAGHVAGGGLFWLTQAGLWPLHFTINVTIMTAFSVLVFVVVSFAGTAPSSDVIRNTVWRKDMALDPKTAGSPIWTDPRAHAVLVFAGVVGIIVGFW